MRFTITFEYIELKQHFLWDYNMVWCSTQERQYENGHAALQGIERAVYDWGRIFPQFFDKRVGQQSLKNGMKTFIKKLSNWTL